MPAKPHPPRCPICRKIRAAHKAGATGRNEIAKKVGCALATVTVHAKHCGITFDRAATLTAVAARQADLKARRARAMERMMTRVEANQDRLEAGRYSYRVILSDGDAGSHSETVADEAPPSADERNHMQVVTGYLASIAKLEQIDGDATVTKASSTISKLAEAFGIADA